MLLFAFIIAAFAAEFDKCTEPQIIKGTTNIYLEDLEDRQVISNKKGIFVQFETGDQSEGYHMYTLSDIEVALIEVVNCSASKAFYGLPWDLSFAANTKRTFYVAVPQTQVEPVVIVVERMLYSEDINKPIEIREEFFPLEVKAHGDLKTGNIYYKIIGRTNWKVDLYIDDEYSTTYDVQQDETEIVTIPIKDSGIHKIKFDYAKDNAQPQKIQVDTYQPTVLNAVFRPNGFFEENDCYEDTRIIVRYQGNAKGKIVLKEKASGVTHVTYLKVNDKCIQVEDGKYYDVNGDYEIILATNLFVTGDSYVIFTVGFNDGSEPIPEPDEPETEDSTSQSGFTEETIIAISVVCGIVGLLMIIALILLIVIIYKKCTKKGGEYQQLN